MCASVAPVTLLFYGSVNQWFMGMYSFNDDVLLYRLQSLPECTRYLVSSARSWTAVEELAFVSGRSETFGRGAEHASHGLITELVGGLSVCGGQEDVFMVGSTVSVKAAAAATGRADAEDIFEVVARPNDTHVRYLVSPGAAPCFVMYKTILFLYWEPLFATHPRYVAA